MRVLVFGDSTAQGYYDTESGGWVNLLILDNLRNRVRRTDIPTEIFNVSISGDTTLRIIARVKNEVEARKWEEEPVTLVFAVGVNDAMENDGKPISSPEQYVAELTELYELAKPLARHVVFVGPESVYEPESAPWIFNRGTHELVWRNDRIKLFDTALQEFCKAKRITFVPVFDAFMARQAKGEQLHADGLHPNAAGHRLLYECVKPIISLLTRE